MYILRSSSWHHNHECIWQLWSGAAWSGTCSSLCSLYAARTVYCSSIVLIFIPSPSKLWSCQPTKELQTIKCRRMRIITSVLYSVKSPVPRSCLPSTLSGSSSAGESVWGSDLLCSPGEESQSGDAVKKNMWMTQMSEHCKATTSCKNLPVI